MLRKLFKQNSHNLVFKALAGFGRSMNRIYENRNHNRHSNGELTVLKKLSKLSPQIIIDGGATIGAYTLDVHNIMPNCQIFSFEPVTSTFDILEENINTFESLYPIPLGLFSKNGGKEIHIYDSNTHTSLYDIQV